MDLRPRYLLLVDILMFFLGFGLVFFLAMAWADDAAAPATEAQTWEDRLERSSPAVRDRSLTAAVATALHLSPALAPYPLAVTTRAGVVTLRGELPEHSLRSEAEALARKTPGVQGVDNRIDVNPRVEPVPADPGGGQARLGP